MASVELSRRVGKIVAYPPLSEMGDGERREFHEARNIEATDTASRDQIARGQVRVNDHLR
jgi:hypothetical protein